MNKKVDGFTLIETIVTLSIVTLIFTSITSFGIMKGNIEKEIEYDLDVYEIQNLLTLSKAKCKKDNIRGEILINTKNDEMYFCYGINGGKLFRKITLSNDSDYIGKNTNIYLNDRGTLTNATTIYVKNSGEINNITIGVGVDTIRIKN